MGLTDVTLYHAVNEACNKARGQYWVAVLLDVSAWCYTVLYMCAMVTETCGSLCLWVAMPMGRYAYVNVVFKVALCQS